jgi:hypothetical protein
MILSAEGLGGPDFVGGSHAVGQEYRNQMGDASHEKISFGGLAIPHQAPA